jgi:predicted MPP superfamily phosphohydrolase
VPQLYYETTRRISYLLIFAGILLIGFGLWQYTHEFSSQTPESVFMSITTKKVVFPLLGLILTAIGYIFLKFVREVEEDAQSIRNELRNEVSRITKMIEKNNDKRS